MTRSERRQLGQYTEHAIATRCAGNVAQGGRVRITARGFLAGLRAVYAPVVGLSFAADDAMFGSHPFGYGVTNLALCLLCAALIATTSRGPNPKGSQII
jgi:hypothetical protein